MTSTFSGSRKPSAVVHAAADSRRRGGLTFFDTACGLQNEIVLTAGAGLPLTCKRCLAACARRDRDFQRKARRGFRTARLARNLRVDRAVGRRLSPAQLRFMMSVAECDPVKYDPYPFGGGREAKIRASAWHRTAHALKDAGLVNFVRIGDHFGASLTDAGRQWLFVNGAS